METADRQIVAWRSDDGVLVAVPWACPHLGTPLADDGQVIGEELVCVAHGWRIATDGSLSKLAMSGRRDPKGRISTIAIREADGAMFVAPATDAGASEDTLTP